MCSHRKAVNEMKVLSEASVDRCRTGMNEVECCSGPVSSEAVDRERASEQDELDQAKRALGKVSLEQGLDCAVG